jgi:hypothetical protein
MVEGMRCSILAVAFIGLLACHDDKEAKAPEKPPATDGCEGDIKTAGRTVGAAAKTGGVAARDGVVQFGSATGALIKDGTDGAKEKWNEKGETTEANARENAEHTRAASQKKCK